MSNRFPARRSATRVRRRVAAVFGAGCCLAALAVPAAALPGDGEDGGGTGSAAEQVPPGGPLLSEPGVQVQGEDGAPQLPSGISALSWTVSDARTGQVLAAKDAHRELPPASTLKTLFAVTVLPRFPGDETHTVTDEDLEGIGAGSSLVGVQAGQPYTVADLWRGVFLASGNDAVHVLAHMNGSVPLTVSQMQAKAQMLGADDTHVVSPDGYDQPGQVSSAYDLAVFARAGLSNRDFAAYASTVSAQFPGGYDAQGVFVKSFGIQNTNRLLTGAGGVRPYPGLIGVKNGYTTNAGNTLVAAAKRHGRTLIVTVMHPQSGLPQAVYKEAGKLLDWGFAAAGRTASVGTLNAAPTAYHLKGIPAQAAAPAKTPALAAAPAQQPPRPAPAPAEHSSNASARAWYVGGGLAVVAAGCVMLLRRRAGGRNR
jgi:D-alanyl-D-alanine carboxypeptidase (penicillin-binding protein 5/6)